MSFGASPAERTGEAWLCADLASTSASGAGGQAMISRALGGGESLHERLQANPVALLGFHADRFPLLFKLLDAAEHLSVQVHPSPSFAARNPGAHLKSEAWYVLSAEPGAELMLGTNGIADGASLLASANHGDLASRLTRIPARPGDCAWLPSGLVHALGAGTVVFEVQTASDTTYRLYDWNNEFGRPSREMHLELGSAASDLSLVPTWGVNLERDQEGVVVQTPDFTLARYAGGNRGPLRRLLPKGEPRCLVLFPFVAPATLWVDGERFAVPANRATVIPASAGENCELALPADGWGLVTEVCPARAR